MFSYDVIFSYDLIFYSLCVKTRNTELYISIGFLLNLKTFIYMYATTAINNFGKSQPARFSHLVMDRCAIGKDHQPPPHIMNYLL